MTFYSQEISNIGKLITFGALNLSLTLRLEKSDIQSLNINFKHIHNLNDIYFIIENEQLWDRIELTTKSELLNTLFHMNRIKRIKNIVAYLIYNKLEFTEEQMKFQKLLDCTLLSNGVVIYSFDVCKCNINIYFNIIYNNNIKKIVLYEDELDNKNKDNNIENSEFLIQEDKEKEKNEEESRFEDGNDDIGIFNKIPEDQVNFNDFKYFYVHFSDYISGGEFCEIIKLKEFYNFLFHIKKDFNTKIIINFGENLKSVEKYLIKFIQVSDFHIFRNKAELFDILMKNKEVDDIKKQRNNQKIMNIFRAQKNQKIKKIKAGINRNESKSSSSTNISLNKLYNSSGGEKKANSFCLNRKLEGSARSLKNILITKSLNISLNLITKGFFTKNNIYNYIHNLIYNPIEQADHSIQGEKLGIYLEDFKNIYIIDYKKLKPKPDIKSYDFNIYPKPNIHNLSEIENIKNLLLSNYSFFSYVIYGCILSNILDDITKSNDNYYIFFFYIRISVLKILSLIKNGMQIPKDKEFYIVELKKNELNKIISDENIKKREEGFNNNYLNSEHKEINEQKEIKPISKDKFGTLYMKGFKNNEFQKTKNSIKGYKTNNKTFMTFIKNKNINTKTKFFENGFWTKRQSKKLSFHAKELPDFSVYLSKEQKKKLASGKLPPLRLVLKNNNKTSISFSHSKSYKFNLKENNIRIEKEKEKKIDTSKYKEIKFQPTRKEIE